MRSGQEIAGLDRSGAAARLEDRQASVKEMQAVLDELKQSPGLTNLIAQAEAARCRPGAGGAVQIELDACTLRAPFAGRLLAAPVSPGQYVAKGATVADLADVSSLRVLVPVDRASATVGGTMNLNIEGQVAAGKVQAVLPLPEAFAPLRELTTALAAAWVVLPNPGGAFEPGQRVLSPAIPTSPMATIPASALRQPEDEAGSPTIQVIRNEYVTTVPVRVLGNPGLERSQVTGPMRPNDALIVSSTVPLLAGTLVRFGADAPRGLRPPALTPTNRGPWPASPPPGPPPDRSHRGPRQRPAQEQAGHTPRPPASLGQSALGEPSPVLARGPRHPRPSHAANLPRFPAMGKFPFSTEIFRSSAWTRRPGSDTLVEQSTGSPRRNGWARVFPSTVRA